MQAEIALLTVIPEEMKWARRVLNIRDKDHRKMEGGTVYWHGLVRSYITKRDYSIVLTCIGYAGNYDCAAATSDVINEYKPKVVLLMGIAAGLRNKVKIGEVVLSERVVAYEPAALVKGEDGTEQIILRPEMSRIEHAIEQDIVNYMSSFRLDLVEKKFRALKGIYPSPSQGMEEEYRNHVTTGVKIKTATIVSGEKLLRHPDKLYVLRRDTHGRIEAGEMEAAGLVSACRRHGIPWLVIRGISDFGDQFKDDRFHEFAAKMASVAMQNLIVYGLDLSTSRLRLQSIPWNLPFTYNGFFTGRKDILNKVHKALTTGGMMALTQPQAISGLGGMGKTQTAVKYAYQYRAEYTAVLWARADSREALISEFVAIAHLLDLPQKDARDKNLAVAAVKQWLASNTSWLLILDNADDPRLVEDFLPLDFKGHILLTSRHRFLRILVSPIQSSCTRCSLMKLNAFSSRVLDATDLRRQRLKP